MVKTKNKKKVYIEITVGVIFVTIAYYFFLYPTNLVIGGVTGLSIILQEYINPVIFIYTCNIGFLILGRILLGKSFFYKTIYGTILMPSLISILQGFNVPYDYITRQISDSNYYLISSFGAVFFTGLGLGIVIRNGATTGGMDVLQRILNKILNIPFSTSMYITDGIIIFLGIGKFGLENGFFSSAIMILSGTLIDTISVGGISKRAIYIITDKPDEMKEAIFKIINRGITEISVIGGYTKKNKAMLICIMGKNQYYRIRMIVDSIDDEAFMFITKANEVLGEGFNTIERE